MHINFLTLTLYPNPNTHLWNGCHPSHQSPCCLCWRTLMRRRAFRRPKLGGTCLTDGLLIAQSVYFYARVADVIIGLIVVMAIAMILPWCVGFYAPRLLPAARDALHRDLHRSLYVLAVFPISVCHLTRGSCMI